MNGLVTCEKRIFKYNEQHLLELEDDIAIEFPLTIIVDGQEFATMVCTPTHLPELVIGFLFSEGLIRFMDEIEDLSLDEHRGFAYVELKRKHSINKDFYSKRFIGSCCGKSRQFYLHNDVKTAKTIMSNTPITLDQCFHLMQQMQETSHDFQVSGGVHNAALCSADQLVVSRSDIGRHNTLDKIYGYCLQHRVSLADKIIAFSGRVSSEVLLKVSKIGVGIVLSKSAPTTLALELAHDLGITVVGFIRGTTLNVYTHPEKIVDIKAR